jgi:malonate-semialdehyde dehydrogenase (acetylating)/methylmalonate-semialdehyde dehydrogenase
MREIEHVIAGKLVGGKADRYGEVLDPNTGATQARVPLADEARVDEAVQAAKDAFPSWSKTNPQKRARVLFEFKRLLELNIQELAQLLSAEHGKVIADSIGDIQRGIDVVEFACGIPHLQKGEYTQDAGPGIDVYSMRKPLGVVAGITPFNFPAMIPCWMFSVAVACGNTFVLKPSEKDPTVPVRLVELFLEAGGPPGVLNCVHGDKVAVDRLLTHPDVKAVSFVGSSDIAQYVYATGTAHGKRVQAMGGAKNHGVILPDCNMEQTVNDVIGAAFGSAGERCMALPVVVAVGKETADRFVEKALVEAQNLRVGISTDGDAHYGPVVSAAHRQKIESYIQMGIDEGATLKLDGRGFKLQGNEEGFFIGPTLFDDVKPEMVSYQEEIFGPVLQVVRVNTLEEAAELATTHQYGNGAAIFTSSGKAAREFADQVEVGMVGVNVPIPVPVAYHTFGGWKRSAFGDVNQHGPEGVRFWTKIKTVTQRWPDGEVSDQAFVIPTME